MESHEEKLHKLVLQSKINETKDVIKHKASEIDKSRIEKKRGDKGGFMSLQSMGSGRFDSGFSSDMNISSSGSGAGFGLSTDVESFSTKSKGLIGCTSWGIYEFSGGKTSSTVEVGRPMFLRTRNWPRIDAFSDYWTRNTTWL